VYGTVDDFPNVLLQLFQGDNLGKLIFGLEDSDGKADPNAS
jgi:NADPH-dependent curcumin reductase CurA